MDRELFDEIFEKDIVPFILQVSENNSRIKIKNMEECKGTIYKEFVRLMVTFKKQIFNTETELLDRHKIASCICGAFLKVSVFDKTCLINLIKHSGERVEAYFFYVNELVAFYAANRFLTFYMTCEVDDTPNLDEENKREEKKRIIERFPVLPPSTKSKRGTWSSMLFNLSRIKDEHQIGLEHYDLYAYAMIFFMLEDRFKLSAA